jgi:hypothetical protein
VNILDWLIEGSVQKLILVIKGVESKETLERWAFDCEMPKENRDVSGFALFFQKLKNFLIACQVRKD